MDSFNWTAQVIFSLVITIIAGYLLGGMKIALGAVLGYLIIQKLIFWIPVVWEAWQNRKRSKPSWLR